MYLLLIIAENSTVHSKAHLSQKYEKQLQGTRNKKVNTLLPQHRSSLTFSAYCFINIIWSQSSVDIWRQGCINRKLNKDPVALQDIKYQQEIFTSTIDIMCVQKRNFFFLLFPKNYIAKACSRHLLVAERVRLLYRWLLQRDHSCKMQTAFILMNFYCMSNWLQYVLEDIKFKISWYFPSYMTKKKLF